MDLLIATLINMPFVILNAIANFFFILCIICPLHGERIKQPLKLLLGSFICCSLIYLITVLVQFSSMISEVDGRILLASYVVFVSSLPTNMTSSVWLNFFYYTQIVPAQRFVFIWIKKNIKPIIYCIWAAERIYTLINAVALLLDCGLGLSFSFHNSSITMSNEMGLLEAPSSELHLNMCSMFIWTNIAYFFTCMCVMVISSSCTAVYLCRHLHRLISNGLPLSCPRLRSHVRVTIFGILQGVLYMLCATWVIYRFFVLHMLSEPFLSHSYHNFTVINFYMMNATCTLGAGQAVFRQRAADLFLRVAQWCKACKMQRSDERDDERSS